MSSQTLSNAYAGAAHARLPLDVIYEPAEKNTRDLVRAVAVKAVNLINPLSRRAKEGEMVSHEERKAALGELDKLKEETKTAVAREISVADAHAVAANIVTHLEREAMGERIASLLPNWIRRRAGRHHHYYQYQQEQEGRKPNTDQAGGDDGTRRAARYVGDYHHHHHQQAPLRFADLAGTDEYIVRRRGRFFVLRCGLPDCGERGLSGTFQRNPLHEGFSQLHMQHSGFHPEYKHTCLSEDEAIRGFAVFVDGATCDEEAVKKHNNRVKEKYPTRELRMKE